MLLKKLTSNLTVNTLHLHYKDQLPIAVIVTIMQRGKTCLFWKVWVGNGKAHPRTGHEGPEV
jgi:hypothetical protein